MRRQASPARQPRHQGWPIFGLSLASLIACAGGAAAGSPALPAGGVVRAGSASIGQASGGALTIDQTSSRAIIDWTSFSIGAGASVAFDNGAGATLNRVTGTSGSALDGALTATGSVYLINPNGVIVGRNGVVDVGGTFAASTQDLADARFMAGGGMAFAGKSTAAVINYGRIGALGGDVALIAARVVNNGTIAAARGDAGLIAGYQVTLRDKALSDGKFAVVLGGAGTSATNAGAIRAAEAELRANGGNVYALAGNTGGLIRADGVSTTDGKVFLVAEGGTLTLAGTIASRGANGTGGRIETSGSTVAIGKAAIDAGTGGAWLLDPDDLTIDQTAANTIAASLNGGTSVTQQTTASGTGGNGDIFVAANVNLTWTTAASLTLSAYRNISLGSASLVKSTGGGNLTLHADNTGDGTGTVSFATGAKAVTGGAVSLFYDPASYATPTNFAPFVSAGTFTPYMLVNTLTQLQAMATNLKGAYALGTNIDAAASAAWNAGAGFAPIGNAASPFKGQFDGQGFTISGLTIDRPATSQVGLFGAIGDLTTLQSVGLAGESVTGSEYVGGLLGSGAGTISGVTVAGTVSGGDYVGGLAGQDQGTITGSWANATVSGTKTFVGGLVGYDNRGQITGSWATGAVTGTQTFVGGLAGYDNAGAISQSYATGTVKGAGDVGGLVGQANGGSITGTWATGAVTANQAYAGGLVGLANGGETILQSWAGGAVSGASNIGGLVGRDVGTLSQSYALGSVKGTVNVGGLIGSSGATVSQTYSTGAVSGSSALGGLIGVSTGGSVTSSYWDTQTSGQSTSAGGAGLTTAQFFTNSSFTGFTFGTTPGAPGWVIVDDGGSLNGCCELGNTRPMLLSEYSTTVVNAHQLQLMALDLNADYTLGADIDASSTNDANPSGIWTTAGFVPVGGWNPISPFQGTFDGQGHTINNLNIFRPTTSYVGLFGVNQGSIENVGLVGGSISGANSVGGLVGENFGGFIFTSDATGPVTGGSSVGGLVGWLFDGTISDSYATGAVSGGGSNLGGLVGFAGSNGATSNSSEFIEVSYASGSVTGAGGENSLYVGGLVGLAQGTSFIYRSYAAGAVSGFSNVGGLVGNSVGQIENTYATGSVNGSTLVGGLVGRSSGFVQLSYAIGPVVGANNVGGLIGRDIGALSQSYALGSVKGATNVGGLIGVSDATVSQTYSTGAVSGQSGLGGLIGVSTGGSVTSSYWDTQTSGQSTSAGGAGLTTAQFFNASNFSGFIFGTSPGASRWVIIDDDGSLNNVAGAAGSVRPMLLSEWSSAIVNVHQLQLMELDLSADYTLGADIDASATSGADPSGIWTKAGFVPVGGVNSWFEGAFDGQGHTITNLVIDRPTMNDVGLFGVNGGAGTIENVGLLGGSVAGASSVGGLAGENLGQVSRTYNSGAVHGGAGSEFAGGLVGYNLTGDIDGSHDTGPVSGGYAVGGLVGWLFGGSVTESYAEGAVSGAFSDVGGLVGGMGSNGATSGSTQSIYKSYSSGSVSGRDDVGGLVGLGQGTSSITQAYASGAVSGSSNVGGLVGNNEGLIGNTYATGLVHGSTLVGGLVGRDHGGPVTASYWDTQTTGQATSQGGTGLTTAQMQEQSSYVGWDFTTIWLPPSPGVFPTLRGVP